MSTTTTTTMAPVDENDSILVIPTDVLKPPGLGGLNKNRYKSRLNISYSLEDTDAVNDRNALALNNKLGDGIEEDVEDGDATSYGNNLGGLFNWHLAPGSRQPPRGMLAPTPGSTRLGLVGRGSRSRGGNGRHGSRLRSRSKLPGVKYMVYTGELNNVN